MLAPAWGIINYPSSRDLLKTLLTKCNDKEVKDIISNILKRLIERNRVKFEENVNFVFSK